MEERSHPFKLYTEFSINLADDGELMVPKKRPEEELPVLVSLSADDAEPHGCFPHN